MIIDAHMHLPTDGIGWQDKKNKLLSEMKRNGVDAGIVISDSETESAIGTTGDCVALFADCPNVCVAAGISPFIDYREQLRRTERFCLEGKIVGIKLYCGHEPIYIDDDGLKPVFVLAERFRIPILFHSGWDNPEYAEPSRVKRAASAYPEIRFVCCHCFYPDLRECFEIIGECPNVYFDVSSVADRPELNSSLKMILEEFIPTMPDRFLFGSDYASCSQREHIEFIQSLKLSAESAEKLFGLNAKRIYHLKFS